MVELRKPHWSRIKNPEGYAKRMSEKERILFIRKYGSERQKKVMKSIFGGNKWKPQKQGVWERCGKGWKTVRTIVSKKVGNHIQKNTSSKNSEKGEKDSNEDEKHKSLSDF